MPRPFTWVARGTMACALVTTLMLSPGTLSAQRTAAHSVVIRGVSAERAPALVSPLRSAVEEALASIDVDGRRSGFVLDVSVTRYESESLAIGERVDCEVSIVVEDAHRHAIRGVLTGRARVIGTAQDALGEAAVRAAARGAMRSLPNAITAR